MGLPYCGPRRRVTLEQALDLVTRGWIGQVKSDGCYVELAIGSTWRAPAPRRGPRLKLDGRTLDHRWRHNQRAHGAIVGGRFRSGRDATPNLGALRGLELPGVPDGSCLVGELQEYTPSSGRWLASRGVSAGVVLFDVLAWGGAPVADQPYARRRALLEYAVCGFDGPAARHVELVEQRREGIAGWYRRLVAEGHEGLVLRDPGAPAGEGMAKLKRKDTIDARVVQVVADERRMTVDWGGMLFSLTLPAFAVVPGQVVEVAAMGHYDSGVPRHAHAVRVRTDLSPV